MHAIKVNGFLEMNAAEMPVAVFTSALELFKFVEPTVCTRSSCFKIFERLFGL